MITVILKNKGGDELAEAGQPGNEICLRQGGERFPLLSELSEYSPDVFGAPDVPELLVELELVEKSLTDPQLIAHIQAIRELAVRAAGEEGAVLLFTPFNKDVRRRR